MKASSKISVILILFAALIIPTMQSCSKYPEGPDFTIRSRTARVANTWKVENYKVNGTDFTSLVASYTETYTKGGAYSYSWGSSSGSGTWTFQNNAKEIRLNGNDEQSSRVLTILKLEEKEFWYYYMDGNDKNEIHLLEK